MHLSVQNCSIRGELTNKVVMTPYTLTGDHGEGLEKRNFDGIKTLL